MLEIPIKALAPELLTAVIEEFASRDGTDYGEEEVSLDLKVTQIREQLQSGVLALVFHEDTETTQIVLREDLQREMGQPLP